MEQGIKTSFWWVF